MFLDIKKNVFLERIVRPLAKLTDECVMVVEPDKIYSIATSNGKGLIGYVEYITDTGVEEPFKANIKEIKKLMSAFKFIDEEDIVLDIDKNAIKYASDSIKFKFPLYEDGSIPIPKYKPKKLLSLDVTGHVETTAESLKKVMSATLFVKSKSTKVYFHTKGHNLVCKITDETIPNLESMTITLDEKFVGAPIVKPIIVYVEDLIKMHIIKGEKVKIGFNTDKGYVIIKVSDESSGSNIRYVFPSVVK